MPGDADEPIDAPSADDGSAERFRREAAGGAEADALPPRRLTAGEIVSDRFVIERFAGSGGMGAVYQALDRVTGEPVALKVMSNPGRDVVRFAQEARVLAKVRHPAIVRYVAHGSMPQGQRYLAMEWLNGEDLGRRLLRSGLSVAGSLDVARRLAEGLSVAHARGVIHRDVKPSNVLLVEGDPARATLLDFGIVRFGLSDASNARARTQTGTILGTVGYMSPEQAIADRELDARADVFALGCVLFECLTGQPAFSGDHVAAVLAKVLRNDVPRVRALRPDLPAALDDLTARLLAKRRSDRPKDGAAVLRELHALGRVTGGAPVVESPESVGLSGGERRLVSVLLARVPAASDRVSEVVGRHGGELARLASGDLLVTLGNSAAASDQLVSAANCALQLHAHFPAARVALAIGRAQTNGEGPSGPVIDRAASLLAESTSGGIRVDEATAGLLEGRFDIRGAEAGHVLFGRRAGLETPRTLLGKPTPCVGRDKELALLEATWRECVEESVAHAVLITGPPGQGKSRLRHEFVARVAATTPGVNVLAARADPVGAGSSFLLARQLVRAAAGLQEAEEEDSKLRQHIADRHAGDEGGRIADFLGVLVGVPSSGRPSPELRAARNDPQIMAEWLRRSFVQWLSGECAARPILVVLEDLHWGDLPSIMYLGEALRTLSSQRLMLLSLARPEVHETFPNLLSGAETNELSLGRLTPRAAERLVRAVLADGPSAETVARVLERAQGNAFFLEELIRRVAESGSETLPETVVALVQSRLEKLDVEARRVARAASVFGEVFWRGAVGALLGGVPNELDAGLARLVEEEIITAAAGSRFSTEREYVFRHGVVREVAYSMLTEVDAVTGHRLAGEWLESAGEKDALTLADHFERGSRPARAVPLLVRASRAAYEGGNLDAALALAARGLACGAEGITGGRLRLVEGVALYSRGDMPKSAEAYRAAMDLLPEGSMEWFQAAASGFLVGTFLADRSITAPTMQAIMQAPAPDEPSGSYAFAVYHACIGLSAVAQYERAWSLLERARDVGRSSLEPDPAYVHWSHLTRAIIQLLAGQPGLAMAALADAGAAARHTLSAHARSAGRMFMTMALSQMGHCPRAEQAARDLGQLSEMTLFIDYASLWLTCAHLDTGRAAEAIRPLRGLLDHRTPFIGAWARAALASALVELGDLDAARREGLAALEQAAAIPQVQLLSLAALARAEMLEGRPADALVHAERGLSITTDAWPSFVATLQLIRAEALLALRGIEDARAAIRTARDRVAALAATIDDRELRDSFVTNLSPNARTLARAREWLEGG